METKGTGGRQSSQFLANFHLDVIRPEIFVLKEDPMGL